MLCERCKHTPATMHYTKIVNGQVTEYHLCEHCAREENLTSEMQEFDIFNLFTPRRENAEATLICPSCKTTVAEFRKTGIAGCAKCYEVFSSLIRPMLKQVHGCDSHIPEEKIAKAETSEDKIARLQKALQQAIAAEEYEKAATIRDDIRQLKEGE